MAVATLGMNELLRPWHNAGLEMLYMDDDMLAAFEAMQKAVPSAPSRPQYGGQSGAPQQGGVQQQSAYGQQAQQPMQQGQPSSPPQQQAPARQAPPRPSAPPRPAQQAKPVVPQSSIRKESPLIEASQLPPEEWPTGWQNMWAKVPVPCPIIWTYWSLGADLGGQANPDRGKLLRSIIGQLNLPKGSSAFWPVAIPGEDGGELQADASIFMAGIRRIRPRYVICFGSKALKTFAPNSGMGPYMFTQAMGQRLIALPDIDKMLGDNRHIPAIVAYLRTAITLRG